MISELNISVKPSEKLRYLFLIWVVFSITGCSQKKEPLLAKVYDDYLYLSNVEGIIPHGSSQEDSTHILNHYVENWVRDKLFENEAKKRISEKDKIERQVKEYRASLINHAYESLIIKEQLDSNLDEEELEVFYEKNKTAFKLEYPLIKCNFIKIAKNKPQVKAIKELWKSSKEGDQEELKRICAQSAELYMLNDTLWNNGSEILLQLPKGKVSIGELSSKKEFGLEDDGNMYLLKILKWMPAGETAPFNYAKSRISDIFLLQRKKEVIEKIKDKIFEKESRRQNFSIYSNRLKINSKNKE